MQTRKHINYLLPAMLARISASAHVAREDDAGAAAAAAAAQATADAAAAAQATLIQKAVDAAVSGLKAKNEELLGKLATSKETLKQFEGLNPEELKILKSKIDNDEDMKLLSEGKTQQVIEKYTERMRKSHLEELAAERERTQAESRRADTYKGSVLDNQIRAAANGLHAGAIEDALLHARQIFSLDAKGNAVKMDAEGRPELGKDGATPFSPKEWMEQQKELKPHWFPSTTTGSNDGTKSTPAANGTGKTMKRADFDKLPVQQQIDAVTKQQTRIID